MIETAWIIDDDDIYRYGFRKFVVSKTLCKKLFDFDNAGDALAVLNNIIDASKFPDVIFLSVDLKNHHCWEFISAFEALKKQQNFKKINIYLITSSINYMDIERGENYPYIADYMIKPVDSKQFTHAFQDHFLIKSA